MRILQVCPRYYPYTGGIERVVQNVSEHLAQRNHQVTVYATDPSAKLTHIRMVKGVEVRNYFAIAPGEAYNLPHPKMLIHLLKDQGDIMHVHSVHDLTLLMAHATRKLCSNSRFVVSPYYHGKGHTKAAQILWTAFRPLVRRILKDANAIIVNSKAEKTAVDMAFKASCRTFVVYDGVDLNQIRNTEPFAFDKDWKRLLYVGRLERYKNIHVVISSLKYLPKNYHFYIIGRGPFQSVLQNLARDSGLGTRVHFLGFQPDATVYRWLRTADVFTHLSEVESFGMACIESLAADTPVIANDDGLGLRETIAFYPKHIAVHRTNRGSASELAKLIMQVAEWKPIRADVSQFSWNYIAENVSKIYQQVLSKK